MNRFSIVENNNFKISELVFKTSSKKVKSMIGLSFGEKLNQLHIRQLWYIENNNKIISLSQKLSSLDEKDKYYEKTNNQIQWYIKRNIELAEEIAKFKVAGKLDGNNPIVDSNEYISYIKGIQLSDIEESSHIRVEELVNQEILNKIRFEEPFFFTRFIMECLKRTNTSSLRQYLQPVLEDHQLILIEKNILEEI